MLTEKITNFLSSSEDFGRAMACVAHTADYGGEIRSFTKRPNQHLDWNKKNNLRRRIPDIVIIVNVPVVSGSHARVQI
ncbi:MAG: hypothetical protein ABUS47_03470 [Steroidobacter sp.]